MKSSIRGVILGTAVVALAGLAGCENNEAGVKGTGVTPPTAVATSDDAGKVELPPSSPPAGYGPAMNRRPSATSKSKAQAK